MWELLAQMSTTCISHNKFVYFENQMYGGRRHPTRGKTSNWLLVTSLQLSLFDARVGAMVLIKGRGVTQQKTMRIITRYQKKGPWTKEEITQKKILLVYNLPGNGVLLL